MNNLLQLKVQFEQKSNTGGGGRKLPANKSVTLSHLIDLRNQLKDVSNFWIKETLIQKTLVTVRYIETVAKSNRIQNLLYEKGNETNDLIVGAKFSKDKEPKHIITYCLSRDALIESIYGIESVINIVADKLPEIISNETFQMIDNGGITLDFRGISKSAFKNILVDSFFVEGIEIEFEKPVLEDAQIVTLYDTGISYQEIFRKLNINLMNIGQFDSNSFLLTSEQYSILRDNAPYLIAMAVTDLNTLTFDEIESEQIEQDIFIPSPGNEPVIGVIDTLFDDQVYFSKWVEYKNLVDSNIPITPEDKDHGTMVSSIIVDGPTLNPKLDDGCGRFRVRHFGVVTGKKFSVFTLLRKVREIVTTNRDIKVWTFCLGSELEIEDNFISPMGALLDELQYENDIIFVVAGTNKTRKNQERIGSPADSINAMVVNSVDLKKNPASYTRKGPVLSFFTKPDVSYYGGVKGQEMTVYYGGGKVVRTGTSFAAPWIARKLAYMIQVVGLSREISKALLVDCAAGWDKPQNSSFEIGFGVVPTRIEDILQSKDDEIRFFMSGVSEKWDTYFYKIPVPVVNEKQPFIAKATLCYFPKCFRNQGVDYTTTELNLQFGRIDNHGKIKYIDKNKQYDRDNSFTKESKARNLFRKWDNIKHIGEFDGSHRSKTVYTLQDWGVSLKTAERLPEKYGKNLKFGIIITLKEINGKNRIDSFIQQCQLRGILVNKIDIETRINVYNKVQEEIELE